MQSVLFQNEYFICTCASALQVEVSPRPLLAGEWRKWRNRSVSRTTREDSNAHSVDIRHQMAVYWSTSHSNMFSSVRRMEDDIGQAGAHVGGE